MIIAKKTIVRLIDKSASDNFRVGDILVAIEADSCPHCVSLNDYRSDYTYADYVNMNIGVRPFASSRLEPLGKIYDTPGMKLEKDGIVPEGSIVKLIDSPEIDWYRNGDIFIAIESDYCPYCVFLKDYNPDYVHKDYVDHYIPVTAFMHYKLEIIGDMNDINDKQVPSYYRLSELPEDKEEGTKLDDEVAEEEAKPIIELTHKSEKKEGKKMWSAITMGALLVTAVGLIIYDLKTNK